MPAMDGFDVLERLGGDQRFAATPIVAPTDSAMERDRERALSVRFTSYIAKAINLKSLGREMDHLLG
jgi:CheY-like chemotaxis protein